MDKIKQAKKLIKLAIDTGDDELIMLANELLEENTGNSVEKAVVPQPKKNPPQKKKDHEDFSLFKMRTEDDNSKKNGIAVNKIQREIKFYDDGSDKNIETPEISLAERKRKPFKMIEQKCQKCSRTVKTHPSHKREWFVCDGCIRR